MNQTVWPATTRRDATGAIEIEGVTLTSLAEEHGTPLYVFSEREIRDTCRAYRRAFTDLMPQARITYAGKAGISGALLQIVQQEGLGLDVVSGGELAIALAAGIDPEEISFHGNNKGPDELREALVAGVGKIMIDNLDEIERIADIAGGLRVRCKVMLRLNPGVDVHTHRKISTGVADSKFGFPITNGQASEAVIRILARPELDLLGYHAHIGSQLFEPDAYISTIEEIIAFAASVRNQHGVEMRHISPGGGFGIAYLDGQTPQEPSYWASVIAVAVRAACQRFGLAEPILTIEPGRSIVGPAGVALYRVGSIKEIPGVRTYVAVDGGMADNIRPSLYDAEYTATIANRATAVTTASDVAVVGKYCESGDILIERISLPGIAVGDLLAVPGSGAYCLPMASNYNGSLRPAVLLLNDGDVKVMRRRETYRDLFRHDPILQGGEDQTPT